MFIKQHNRILIATERVFRRWMAALVLVCSALSAHATFPQSDLRDYYFMFPFVQPFPAGVTSNRPRAELLPLVRVVGGGFEPPPLFDADYSLYSLVSGGYEPDKKSLRVYQYREHVCDGTLRVATAPVVGSRDTIIDNIWYLNSTVAGATCQGFPEKPPNYPKRLTTDEITYGAPVRRAAIDGSQYDASPMVLKRNGLPWYTHYFGYHLGLIANESNWDNANLSRAGDMVGFFTFPSPANNFNLSRLPPPWVEDDVVEYVNRVEFPNQPGGQFFYTAIPFEKTLLDSVPAWQRTGSTFKSGGYVSACRFYGGKNGGPNTHFYSADDKECAMLKQVSFLEYEGQSFAVNMPMPAKTVEQQAYGALKDCPIDSKPLYRLYNNADNSGGRFVSNHRYVTERAAVDTAVAQGWRDEGHVMCVPI